MGGGQSARKYSVARRLGALLVAALAAAFPLILILYALKGFDLVAVPTVQTPTSGSYRDAIAHVVSTSGSLLTIGLTILAADVVWFLRSSSSQPIRHLGLYAVFTACITSIYFGIKLGYSAGVTLSGTEPEIKPLLSLLRNQALLALIAGLLLTGIVVFSSLVREDS